MTKKSAVSIKIQLLQPEPSNFDHMFDCINSWPSNHPIKMYIHPPHWTAKFGSYSDLSISTISNLQEAFNNSSLLSFLTQNIKLYIYNRNENTNQKTLRHRHQQFQQRSSYFNLSPATSTICLATLIPAQVTIKLHFYMDSLILYQIACSCIRLYDSVSDAKQINKYIYIYR